MRLCVVPAAGAPAFYDRLMHECFRGGLDSPRIVQEGLNEATILSLISHGMGVGWVNGTARWRCPESVVIMSVVDLDMPLPPSLATIPLLCSAILLARYGAWRTCEHSRKEVRSHRRPNSRRLDTRPLLAHIGRTTEIKLYRGHFNGRAPEMRISTSLRALCCQSGLAKTLATPTRRRSIRSGSLRMSPLLMARFTSARIAP